MRRLFLPLVVVHLGFALAAAQPAAPSSGSGHRVRALKVTVLSTMLADAGIGEWGFAALVEVDGRRLLFDTGDRPATVLDNAREMKIDLTGITDVILSHNHADHTGGLLALRKAFGATDKATFSRVHVGDGIFDSRPSPNGERNILRQARADYEQSGGTFVVHRKPAEILPGVWLTGPVPRVHPERNFTGGRQVQRADGLVEDTIPEDMALVFDTDQGLVVLTGCGHAGIINIVDYARKVVRDVPVHATLGGFHLYAASDEALAWTSDQLRAAGVAWLLGAHCTGIEAVYRMRERAGLSRKTCVVGAVGSSFTLGAGIDPRSLAR
jgi:7,8-dihydropterin-6-yl-methyl-4-(beta-D-ribofuranosyl)aminobenzene 5'-phosphate synthase